MLSYRFVILTFTLALCGAIGMSACSQGDSRSPSSADPGEAEAEQSSDSGEGGAVPKKVRNDNYAGLLLSRINADTWQDLRVNLESGALKLSMPTGGAIEVEGVGNTMQVEVLESALSNSELEAGRELFSSANVSFSTEWFDDGPERQLVLDVQWPVSFDVPRDAKLFATSIDSLRASEPELASWFANIIESHFSVESDFWTL